MCLDVTAATVLKNCKNMLHEVQAAHVGLLHVGLRAICTAALLHMCAELCKVHLSMARRLHMQTLPGLHSLQHMHRPQSRTSRHTVQMSIHEVADGRCAYHQLWLCRTRQRPSCRCWRRRRRSSRRPAWLLMKSGASSSASGSWLASGCVPPPTMCPLLTLAPHGHAEIAVHLQASTLVTIMHEAHAVVQTQHVSRCLMLLYAAGRHGHGRSTIPWHESKSLLSPPCCSIVLASIVSDAVKQLCVLDHQDMMLYH